MHLNNPPSLSTFIQRTIRVACTVALIALLWPAANNAAGSPRGIVLRLKSDTVSVAEVCRTHGWKLVRRLGAKKPVYLVHGPESVTESDLAAIKKQDTRVANAELSDELHVAEEDPGLSLVQSTAAILEDDGGPRTFAYHYGGSAWESYLSQNAVGVIRASEAHVYSRGAGIVAIIDTGIDPNHPALQGALVPGYDFVNNVKGQATEWGDLTQSTAAILEQSTAALLEEHRRAVILSQSTAAILEEDRPTQLVPSAFGHGTMVAGLVRLAAPTAKIMPLKAFRADGSSNLADIVRAIYYAADNGARVINMSFVLVRRSAELEAALAYAKSRGVISVAAAGNNAKRNVKSYPSMLETTTIGVGSTTLTDARSAFSNYGNDILRVAAPGEDLITTYPNGRYAMVAGTSYSSALVAGAVSVLLGINSTPTVGQVDDSFSLAKRVADMGHGRLDMFQAARYWAQESR